MSLNISRLAGKVERPNIAQRAAAILGLGGLVLAWAVMLVPCLVWLIFSLISQQLGSRTPRPQA
ncbi:hypothetical protein BH10PSE4_BH10PSE4_07170 [soil metagenome]